MKSIFHILIVSCVVFITESFVISSGITSFKEVKPAEKIELKGFKNLYKINDSIYRAEQPTKAGMKALDYLGIKTVLNFRNHHNDKDEAAQSNLIIERIALNTNKITYADIVQSLKIIQKAKKPILLHCLHGSDRTGCMIAAYRMVYDGYTKEQAILELTSPEFGYHKTWFPNIIELLNAIDVEQLKKDVSE